MEDFEQEPIADQGMERATPAKHRRRVWNRWPERLVLVGLLAMTIFVASVQGFWVSGDCMRPDLVTGDRLLADKLTYRLHAPVRGDIVIFYYPRDPRQIYVKRVIGLPGETVEKQTGDVYIDGRRLAEPYRIYAAHGSMDARIVPAGQYFVMGDNRDVSDDSRHWGYLPRREIIGRAVGRYWPLFGAHRPAMASPH
jgi:signal peptidase I